MVGVGVVEYEDVEYVVENAIVDDGRCDGGGNVGDWVLEAIVGNV